MSLLSPSPSDCWKPSACITPKYLVEQFSVGFAEADGCCSWSCLLIVHGIHRQRFWKLKLTDPGKHLPCEILEVHFPLSSYWNPLASIAANHLVHNRAIFLSYCHWDEIVAGGPSSLTTSILLSFVESSIPYSSLPPCSHWLLLLEFPKLFIELSTLVT